MLLEKAYVSVGQEWAKEAVDDIVVDNLLVVFRRGYLFVSEGTETRTVSFEAMSHYLDAIQRAYTVNQLMTKITMADLPPHEEVENLGTAKYVTVYDIHSYDLALSLGNANYGVGSKIPLSEKTDLVMTPMAGNDNAPFFLEKDCFVSINGHLRAIERVGDRLFARDVDQPLSKAGNVIKTAMLWDFRAVGGATFVPFKQGELAKIEGRDSNFIEDYIRYRYAGDVDFSEKTIYLVVDGRPLLLANNVKVYSRDTLTFTISRKMCAEWLLEYAPTRRYGHNDNNLLRKGLVLNDWDPISMLTSGYSGLLIVNSNKMGTAKRPLGRTGIPGVFTYPYLPTGVAVMSDNTIRDYAIDGYDGDQASLSIVDGVRRFKIDTFSNTESRSMMSRTEASRANQVPLEGYMVNLFSL